MKSSPIQAKNIVYGEFCIVPADMENDNDISESFDWNGVQFKTSIRHEKIAQGEEDSYALFLRIEIPGSAAKQAPYAIKASVMGLFTYTGDKNQTDALDLVVVNGLSILYSSLRETILGMTTRMINGALCLPGANFMDHAPSSKTSKAESKKRPVTKKAKDKSTDKD